MTSPKRSRTGSRAVPSRKTINLALQGGGSHGAFAWGALDALLEDGRIEVEGISATSAGAMNAVVYAQGMLNGDRDYARSLLEDFWRAVSEAGTRSNPFKAIPMMSLLTGKNDHNLEQSPIYQMADLMTRVFSPYQLNPFNLNPLRTLLEEKIDFDCIRHRSSIKLNICATNVETCKVRIFENKEISADAILASACLPLMFQAVEIDGQHYWDGGYIGNPAIFPLIYQCHAPDVVIVHINPIVRTGVPTSASEILNRLNEVSFNSSLMREMRAIAFVSKLIADGKVKKNDMKNMYIHSIRSDDEMSKHSAASKLNTDWEFITQLRDEGRAVTLQWLKDNFAHIGKKSSVDLRKEFL